MQVSQIGVSTRSGSSFIMSKLKVIVLSIGFSSNYLTVKLLIIFSLFGLLVSQRPVLRLHCAGRQYKAWIFVVNFCLERAWIWWVEDGRTRCLEPWSRYNVRCIFFSDRVTFQMKILIQRIQVANRYFGVLVASDLLGPIATLKLFEDNTLVREVLSEAGEGRVLRHSGAL